MKTDDAIVTCLFVAVRWSIGMIVLIIVGVLCALAGVPHPENPLLIVAILWMLYQLRTLVRALARIVRGHS